MTDHYVRISIGRPSKIAYDSYGLEVNSKTWSFPSEKRSDGLPIEFPMEPKSEPFLVGR